MSRTLHVALGVTTTLCVFFPHDLALAQTTPQSPASVQTEAQKSTQPLQITITANRSPTELQRTGSAISVVSSEEIAKTSAGSLVDALRLVPGLDISETGGPGAATSVRIRGANAGQTLVLIDGIRVNDPSGTSNDFDFSTLAPGLIERVEVLRGPQSALYGSDAIGGVVNIITKRGRGPFQAFGQIEGGSYGSSSANAGFFGSQGPWSYAFAGSAAKSAGFSRYGDRIGRIEAQFPTLENDGYSRFGGYGRLGYDPGNGFRFETGIMSITTRSQYDAAFGTLPDTPSKSERRFDSVWAKASIDTLDNRLTHGLTVFANRTDRSFWDVSFRNNTLPANTTRTKSEFVGDRVGIEYQGDLKLDAFGRLMFGAKAERETAETYSQNLQPVTGLRRKTQDESQTTRSLFALWQLPIGDRLDVSLGGRVDDVVDVARFNTWRATAAYRIPETGTKLRASVGTGGKAPTLFQLYAPTFGNADLSPERSFGYDAGIDQDLFGGKARVSVTAFANRLSNLIDFDTVRSRYFNVARAETSGVEVSGDVELVQDLLRFKGAYTYLHAKDRLTGLTLARRPEHVGKISLAITPTTRWTIEPSVTLVSGRFSGSRETQRLAPYAKLDIYTDYRIDANWKAYARLENLTNAKYQEVYNYGTSGRAVYAGLKATW
jgi:vitamin B12 transporter